MYYLRIINHIIYFDMHNCQVDNVGVKTNKRANTGGNDVHDEVSTSGLELLARIIARYHLNQLNANNSASSSYCYLRGANLLPPESGNNNVHPAVPRGQAGGQVDGQADGHSKKEGPNGPAQPDLDPAI